MTGVVRFAESFLSAAHDVALEKKRYRVYHFFDSDFLHRVVFGYRDAVNRSIISASAAKGHHQTDEQLFMGALFAQDLGRPELFRALPPHLHELRMALTRRRDRGRKEDLESAVHELGITSILGSLTRGLQDPVAETAFAKLLDEGPDLFYSIDLVSGTVESRLASLIKYGVHLGSPFDLGSDVVSRPAFNVLTKHVGYVNQTERPAAAVNGFRDAMALTMLAEGVAAVADRNEPCDIARFYTETPRILNAWSESPEVRALLQYDRHTKEPGGPDPAGWSLHGTARTTLYYLIRALVPELGYDPSKWTADVDEVSLYNVGRNLAEAAHELQQRGITDEATLAELSVGKRTLGEYMADVTGLSTYRSAWRRLMKRAPSTLPERLRAGLAEVVAVDRRRSDVLDAQFQGHLVVLSESTTDVEEFTAIYSRLTVGLREPTVPLRSRPGGLTEHFGLIRWGFAPTAQTETALNTLIDQYESWRAAQRTNDFSGGAGLSAIRDSSFLVDVAMRIHSIGSAPMEGAGSVLEEACLLGFVSLVCDESLVCEFGEALLKGLALFVAPTSGRDTGQTRSGRRRFAELAQLGGPVENMVVAAKALTLIDRMGSAGGLTRTEVLSEVLRLVDGLHGRRRFECSRSAEAITVGYILFHLWRGLNPTQTSGPLNGTRRPELLVRSLNVCGRALSESTVDDPAHLLLLNHCLYVASVAGLGPEVTTIEAASYDPFVALKGASGPRWTYRYDDTLGFYCYSHARKVMAQVRDGVSGTAALDRVRADIALAWEFFAAMGQNVRDNEVVSHKALLRKLETEVDEFGGLTRAVNGELR